MAHESATPNDVLRQAQTVGREVVALRETVRGAARTMSHRIDVRGTVSAHPYRAVGIAIGVGYVLGGGLFSRLTSQLLRLSVRVAVAPAMRNELASLFRSSHEDVFANVQADERSVQ